MRVATWNINNVNLRLPLLLAWLEATRPDVVALQELKSTRKDFPAREIERAGYGALVVGQKTWNGVALLARDIEPNLVRQTLPGDSADKQARYVEAAVNGVIVTSIYAPNGNPWPGDKFAYKLAWFERLIRHAAELLASGHHVVLAGDCNVVPHTQGHLHLFLVGRQRLDPTGGTRRIHKALEARVDGLDSQAASRGADVQLLGLSTESMGTRFRFTHRSLARKQDPQGKASRRGSGSRSPCDGGCQRPCAGVDGSSDLATAAIKRRSDAGARVQFISFATASSLLGFNK